MKIRISDLRNIISEEYLRGVPEFVLRRATEKYVDEIRQHVTKFVLLSKSDDAMQRKEALSEMNATMEDLEDELNQVLQDKLWEFTQRV